MTQGVITMIKSLNDDHLFSSLVSVSRGLLLFLQRNKVSWCQTWKRKSDFPSDDITLIIIIFRPKSFPVIPASLFIGYEDSWNFMRQKKLRSEKQHWSCCPLPSHRFTDFYSTKTVNDSLCFSSMSFCHFFFSLFPFVEKKKVQSNWITSHFLIIVMSCLDWLLSHLFLKIHFLLAGDFLSCWKKSLETTCEKLLNLLFIRKSQQLLSISILSED